MRGSQLRGRGNTPRSVMRQAGAAALALAMMPAAWAGQVTGAFAVRAQLFGSASCFTAPQSSAQTSTLLIDCRAKPIGPAPSASTQSSQGQALRFHIPSSNGESRYGAVDLFAGAGTITSWRIVHLADWDYLEMTVGW